MSRSRKKHAITGIACCNSEKADKKLWHGRARVRIKQMLREGKDVSLFKDDNFSNPWAMAKDGSRHYIRLKDQHKDWAVKARRK